MSSGLDTAGQRGRTRPGTLRQVVRQELVARQLAAHLPAPPARILAVGCGHPTNGIQLTDRSFPQLALTLTLTTAQEGFAGIGDLGQHRMDES